MLLLTSILNTKIHTSLFSWLDLTLHFSRRLQLDFWTYTKLPFLIRYLSLAGFHKHGKSPSSNCSRRTFIQKTQVSARHYVNLIPLKLNIWAQTQASEKLKFSLLFFLWPIADRLFRHLLCFSVCAKSCRQHRRGIGSSLLHFRQTLFSFLRQES